MFPFWWGKQEERHRRAEQDGPPERGGRSGRGQPRREPRDGTNRGQGEEEDAATQDHVRADGEQVGQVHHPELEPDDERRVDLVDVAVEHRALRYLARETQQEEYVTGERGPEPVREAHPAHQHGERRRPAAPSGGAPHRAGPPGIPAGKEGSGCPAVPRASQRRTRARSWRIGLPPPGWTRAALPPTGVGASGRRSEEHTSELQSPLNLVCRLLLEK